MPNILQSCSKNRNITFYLKGGLCFSKQPIKSPYIWATLVCEFVAKTLQNSQIWPHCLNGQPIFSLLSSFQQLTEERERERERHVLHKILHVTWFKHADLRYLKRPLCQLSHSRNPASQICFKKHLPWSSLEEGDEQLDRPNSQTCIEYCHTTAYHLGRWSLHLLIL